MKKLYKTHDLERCFQKGILAASFIGAAFISGNLNAQTTPTYCASNAYFSYGSEILNVTLGTLNNSSTCGTTAGGPGSIQSLYSNFTAPTVAAVTLVTGVNYALSVTVGDCNNSTSTPYVGVWIDFNQNGSFTDPGEQVWATQLSTYASAGTVYSPLGGINIPTTNVVAGTTRMRVVVNQYNQPSPCQANTYNYDYGETEDYSITLQIATPCSTTPSAGSISAPTTSLCSGSQVFLAQSPSNLLGGVTYSWQSASSSVGPYTNIANANNSTYLPLVSTSTWYRLVSQCAVGGSTVAATPAQVLIAATTTSTVPYYEGFEEPQIQQDLPPNCSWNASVPSFVSYGSTANYNNFSPNTGNGMAIFGMSNGSYYYGPAISYYLYSNGVQLNAGVTYSGSVFYAGYNYSNVTIAYGTSQSPAGLVTIATSVSGANSTNWKNLSDTFQVATSGIYYIALSGDSPYTFDYMVWDDLSITAPCNLTNNKANISLTGPANGAVCLGKNAILNASGAGSYTWSTGSSANSVTVSPTIPTVYSVDGTNVLSNCITTKTINLFVNPNPGIQILPSVSTICSGQTATLYAISANGAISYTWSTQDSGPTVTSVTVSPNATTTYNVVDVNAYGCTSTSSQIITVDTPPSITVTGNLNICKGEPGSLQANGAKAYTWSSASSYLTSNPISPYPTVNTTYTVTGLDDSGCPGTTVVNITVNACTGLKSNSAGIANLQVYPNPNSGVFTVELNNGLTKNIEVLDVTGRIILANTSENDQITVNINNLSNGIYYVKVKSDNAVEVLKVVKQ